MKLLWRGQTREYMLSRSREARRALYADAAAMEPSLLTSASRSEQRLEEVLPEPDIQTACRYRHNPVKSGRRNRRVEIVNLVSGDRRSPEQGEPYLSEGAALCRARGPVFTLHHAGEFWLRRSGRSHHVSVQMRGACRRQCRLPLRLQPARKRSVS